MAVLFGTVVWHHVAGRGQVGAPGSWLPPRAGRASACMASVHVADKVIDCHTTECWFRSDRCRLTREHCPSVRQYLSRYAIMDAALYVPIAVPFGLGMNRPVSRLLAACLLAGECSGWFLACTFGCIASPLPRGRVGTRLGCSLQRLCLRARYLWVAGIASATRPCWGLVVSAAALH